MPHGGMVSVSAIIVTRGDVDLSEILASIPPEWERIVWNNGHRKVTVSNSQETWWSRAMGKAPAPSTSHIQADLAVMGRYEAIKYALWDVVYVQDDDVLLSTDDMREMVRTFDEHSAPWCWRCPDPKPSPFVQWEDFAVCNMPLEFRHDGYIEHSLVGFGAVFHRDAPAKAFGRFWNRGSFESDFAVHLRMPLDPEEVQRSSREEFIVNPPPPRFFQRTCDVVFTALTPCVLVDVPKTNLPWATDDNRMYRQKTHVGERQRMLDLALQVRDS